MRGNLRRKNRSQAQREIIFKQGEFSGGWVNDLPGSDLPKDSMALLDNFVAFPEYLEGRGGSQNFSATTLPGSGTIKAFFQHPTNKKFLLARGLYVYVADNAMASWTLVPFYTNTVNGSVIINGDTSNQLSGLDVSRPSTTNTNNGTVYWNLTNSGGVRTLNVYKNLSKTQLVAQGVITGNGYVNLIPQNNSGLSGRITITYTIDDTDAANTFVITFVADGVASADNGLFRAFKNDALFFTGSTPSAGSLIYINLTSQKARVVGSQIVYPVFGSGTQSATTPYGYRYICTCVRIEDSQGNPDYSSTRISGILAAESAATSASVSGGSTSQNDYGEFWLTNPRSGANPHAFIFTRNNLINGTINFLDAASTHVGIYTTLDIGVNGTDPITGQGNNREIYTWVADIAVDTLSVSISKTDDEIRASYANGFGLRTRFWTPMLSGEVGEIAGGFLYTATRGSNTVKYGQLAKSEFIGNYNPSFQYLKLNDGVQIIAKSPDMVSFICNNKSYISSPNSYMDAGSSASGPVYTLQHLTAVSENIGCSDYGSFSEVDGGSQMSMYGASPYTSYIAHCSDHTVRIWNHSSWSDDLSSRKVNLIVQQMVNGSVGLYCRGVYYLWYRTDSNQTNNNLCLRFGLGRDTGIGWSKVSGAAWIVPPTNAGACVFIDINSVQRMIVLDAVDALAYWIEPFTSYTGASLSKYFKDKVAVDGSGGTTITCKARFREITDDGEEDNTLFHRETHLLDRPYDESVGYASGMQRNLLVYIDGSTTAADTLTNIPNKADLQFFNTITGRRLQMEVQYTTSQVRLTGINILLDSQDKMGFGAGPPQYADATNQANLAQNMTVWLCRPYPLLNRITGASFTLTGTAPTTVTGPDTKTYALSFSSGANYSLASTTTYTDFAVHFWVKSTTVNKKIFQMTGTNSFYVKFTNNTNLNINGAGNISVSTIASGFHSFWIIRSGSTISVYQNGILNGSTVSVATARGGTTFDINPDGGAMILDDIRVYTTAPLAADFTYYYADVTSVAFTGNKVLPLA